MNLSSELQRAFAAARAELIKTGECKVLSFYRDEFEKYLNGHDVKFSLEGVVGDWCCYACEYSLTDISYAKLQRLGRRYMEKKGLKLEVILRSDELGFPWVQMSYYDSRNRYVHLFATYYELVDA